MQTDESVQKICRLNRSLFYISVTMMTSPPEYSLGMVHGRATKDCQLIPKNYIIHDKNADRSKFSFFQGNYFSHLTRSKIIINSLFC